MSGWRRAVMWAVAGCLWGSAAAGVAQEPVPDPWQKPPGQEPSEEDRAAARDAFKAGVAAARQGRWEDARVAFEQAHARVPRAAILLNLAGAQRQTGHLVEAAASYRAFLARATEGPAAAHRQAATEALADLEERIGQVTVRADGIGPGDHLVIGDRVVPLVDLPGPIPVDPGDHVLEVHRGSQVVARAPFSIEEGEEATVEVEVPPAVPSPGEAARAGMEDPPSSEPLDDTSERRSIARSPWLWTGVGAVVLAGVATALALSLRSSGPSPHEGNFPPGTVTVD
jgi:hypothetical protein